MGGNSGNMQFLFGQVTLEFGKVTSAPHLPYWVVAPKLGSDPASVRKLGVKRPIVAWSTQYRSDTSY